MDRTSRALLLALLAPILFACGGGGSDKDTTPPAAPTGLVAVAGNAQVTLQWTAVADADLAKYEVYAGTAAGALTKSGEATATSHLVTTLTNGTTYWFAVAAVDGAGNVSARSEEVSATPLLPDTTPPLVSSISPSAGATGVAVDAGLVVNFSEAMDGASVTVTLEPPFDLGVPSWSGQDQVAFLPAAPFAFNTNYTVTVAGADLAGNPLGGTKIFTFTTVNPPDLTAPTLLGHNPADAAAGQPAGVNLTFTFSEPMSRTSVEGALQVSPAASTCLWSWSSDSTYAQCDFSANLAYGQGYDVTMGTGATDLAGNHLAAATAFHFTTEAAPDVVKPTVVSSAPADAATGVFPETHVVITFSEPMDQAVTQSAFQVTSPAGQNGGVFSWNPAGTVMTYDLPTNLSHGVTVSWTVGTGARDLAGNTMAAAVSRTFRVAYSKTVTMSSDAPFDGYMYDTGLLNQATGGVIVGDVATNAQAKAWLYFNHTGVVTPTPSRIVSATLGVYQYSCTGDPYANLDRCWRYPLPCICQIGQDCLEDLMARHVDAGTTLTSADFATAPLSSVELSNSATVGWKTVSVTSQVAADRSAPRTRTQFRLEFPVPTNTDGVADYCALYSGDAASLKPYLSVTFEYP